MNDRYEIAYATIEPKAYSIPAYGSTQRWTRNETIAELQRYFEVPNNDGVLAVWEHDLSEQKTNGMQLCRYNKNSNVAIVRRVDDAK